MRFIRPVKTLRVKTLRIEVNDDLSGWQSSTPAMAASLTDHIWTIEDIMLTVVVPEEGNTKRGLLQYEK
jgi:hypothetical protein